MTTDDASMRLQLQRVAAYRELCRAVRRSGRDNVIFAVLMLYLTHVLNQQNAIAPLILTIYAVLIGAELLIGLFKWFRPSPEGALLDGLVILGFAALYFSGFLVGGPQPPAWVALLGLLLIANGLGQFQRYATLRREFANRPSREHIAWFDDLVHEIRASDPESDEHAIDLPTRPHWKAKLLGPMAFFVSVQGGMVWVAGPDDFELLREKTDRGTGRRRAQLRIGGDPYPEFEITDATWANYSKWRSTYPFKPTPAEAAT